VFECVSDNNFFLITFMCLTLWSISLSKPGRFVCGCRFYSAKPLNVGDYNLV
jgi:hypothetical protein